MERIKLILFLLPILCFSFAVASRSKPQPWRYVVKDVNKAMGFDKNRDGYLDDDEFYEYERTQHPDWNAPGTIEAHRKSYCHIMFVFIDRDQDMLLSRKELQRST